MIRNHVPYCPNEIKSGNAIDQLKESGGFSKQQKRRRLESLLRRVNKVKQELTEIEDSEMEELVPVDQDVIKNQREWK